MEKINLYFIHGFLGQPADWERVLAHLNLEPSQFSVHSVNLWTDCQNLPLLTFESWAQNFCEKAQQKKGKNVLVGYSLGGRLAMMALKECSQLWSQVILVSANLSYDDDWNPSQALTSERQQRKDHDLSWCHRFLNEEWSEVVKAWNDQAVFKGSLAEPQRPAEQFDRALVAKLLSSLSQAYHSNMRSTVSANSSKVWAFVGDQDKKYQQLWQEFFSQDSRIQLEVIPESGHRILFDQPAILAGQIQNILSHQK